MPHQIISYHPKMQTYIQGVTQDNTRIGGWYFTTDSDTGKHICHDIIIDDFGDLHECNTAQRFQIVRFKYGQIA